MKTEGLVLDTGAEQRTEREPIHVVDLYEGGLVEPERLLYPDSVEAAAREQAALLESLAKFKLEGGHIGVVDGAFDVPHDNHVWYLRHVRLLAAQRHFGREFDVADNATRRLMVASDQIALLLTLDADLKIAAKKGMVPEKGGIPRPVYPWQARAGRIGGLTVPAQNGHRPVVDLVTVEGDPGHLTTMFESHLHFGATLAAHGLLDTWTFFDEHSHTITEARTMTAGNEGAIVTIPADINYAQDPRTGRTWSSSSIIRRIRAGLDDV